MSPTGIRLLLSSAAIGILAFVGSEAARAADAPLVPIEQQAAAAKVELIDHSRLGCGQGVALWTATNGGTQCAFDTATRGVRMSARQEVGSGSVEVYATVARNSKGAFTPDQLLIAPSQRSNETTNVFLAGVKANAFDNRLKLTAEFARTDRVVDELLDRDWALSDWTSRSGSSAMVRLDATLADRPGLKWSLSGEYRSTSEDFSVGRSTELFRHFAMPGTSLSLSSKARIGDWSLSAGLQGTSGPFGDSATRKASVDFQGITLTLRSRESSASAPTGPNLVESRTRTNAAYLDLDSHTLAAWLFPDLDKLPDLVPATISLSYRAGETENRYDGSTQSYDRSSLGIDGGWETPIGETNLSYWRDSRTALTDNVRSGSTETFQVSHFMRRGHWRFGLDAALSRSRFTGDNGYSDRSLSFGQSVAYSAPDGPEFRLHLGQDRGQMRMMDDSYASQDSYSSITASLDLSKYLQRRFERTDLRLTVDYRKALERSGSEMSLYDQLVERWVDGYRRQGLLMSFGMKL
jgi:hypothetical protein